MTVKYGIFKDGKPVLILKSIKNYPDDAGAISLLNGIVGYLAKGVEPQLMDGHYFAWDFEQEEEIK